MSVLRASDPGELTMYKQQAKLALSPLGYIVSSLGGLACGVGLAFLVWHLI